MSQREKLNPNKTRRTSIEEISAIGNELSEEHLRLASGGAPKGSKSVPTKGSVRSNNGQTDRYTDESGPPSVFRPF